MTSFENAKEEVIEYFAKPERIQYFKDTFGIQTTEEVLKYDYGRTMFGGSWCDSQFWLQCKSKSLQLTRKEDGTTQTYVWKDIAKEVDKRIKGIPDIPTIFDFMEV